MDEFLNRWQGDVCGRALDLGCGEGRDAIHLARRGYSVTAVDISAVGLAKLGADAKKEGVPVECQQVDVRSFPFQTLRFDVIVARTILDHLPQTDARKLADKMTTALAHNGLLFTTVFTIEDPGAKSEKKHASECAQSIKHYFDQRELRDLFPLLQLLLYQESYELDSSHGQPHYHGKANYVGRKP